MSAGLNSGGEIQESAAAPYAVLRGPGCAGPFAELKDEGSAGGARRGAAARLLIVDDDPQVRGLFVRALSSPGRVVESAADAHDALGRLESGVYDVVVTDINMPGKMDGQDVFRWIKDRRASTDVILLSGDPTIESVLEAFRYGAWDFIIKPAAIDVLRASVSRCLQCRRNIESIRDPEDVRKKFSFLYQRVNALESMRGTLRRYLSKEVMDKVLGSAGALGLKSERLAATVLFADIRNFTSFAESRPPEEVIATINSLFERINSAVAKYGGIIDKHTGDGVMAVFGAPRRQQDHAVRAVLCAWSMVRETARWNAERRRRGLAPLEIGVGINTGEVVAGNVGSSQRSDYTVVGSTVNLAARIQERAEAAEVLMGQKTAAALGPKFPVRPLGSFAVKGYSLPAAIFKLLHSAPAQAARLAPSAGLQGPAVPEQRLWRPKCQELWSWPRTGSPIQLETRARDRSPYTPALAAPAFV